MSENQPKEQPSEELDLGQLFKIIGRGFERLFRFFGNIFYQLFLAFVWLVFFTKRHLIKLILAGVLGFSYGFIMQKTSRPVYKSTTIIKQNYKTGENLYHLVDFYNDLISERDSGALSQSLNITEAEANMINGFGVESTLSDNEKLKLFDSYIREMDSVLASTVEFDNFNSNFDEFDFTLQKISIRSYSKDIFNKVLKQLVNNVESSTYFRNEQTKDIAELDRRENAIKQSLVASDSLQKVYQKVLEKSVENISGSQTSVTIDNTEDKSITKEFELFNTDLELKRELVEIQRRKDDINDIIEIVSSEQSEGTLDNSKDVFGMSISKSVFYGLLLAVFLFMILLLLAFLKLLERYKNKI